VAPHHHPGAGAVATSDSAVPASLVREVFLARHGETEWNLIGRWQGQLDAPLTPAGMEEVGRMADLLRALPIDGIFSSPLGRSMASARMYAEALGLTVVMVDELAEIHHGAMAGLSRDEIDAAFPGQMSRRAADKYRWRFPEGESYADGDGRAAAALRLVECSGAVRPLLVSHEMVGRMLLRNLLGLTPDEALARGHPHGVVYRIDVAAKSLEEIRA
jgi:broad specificity phosphatase PhoE